MLRVGSASAARSLPDLVIRVGCEDAGNEGAIPDAILGGVGAGKIEFGPATFGKKGLFK